MSYDGLASPTHIEWGSADRTYGQVKFGDDKAQVVLFYTRSVFNAAKSQALGSRQYENEIWVKMHPPGERLNIIDRPVNEMDKRKYAGQWNMFLQNRTQIPEGTPIDLLFPNNPATADNLRAFGIHTIQQCANLSAHALQTIGMGGQEWMNMAKQYLESATSGTAFLALRAELTQKDQEIRLLKQQFERSNAMLQDLQRRIANPNAGYNNSQNWADGSKQQIDANHPSQQLRPSNKQPPAPPSGEVEQANILRQVTEADFPVVDVTKDQPLDFGLGVVETK